MKNRDEKMRLRYQQREEKRFADMLYERDKLAKYAESREETDKEKQEKEQIKKLLKFMEKTDEKKR